ncbi:MAG: hypothetical protein ABJL99_24600 [Aliishimia sp.]
MINSVTPAHLVDCIGYKAKLVDPAYALMAMIARMGHCIGNTIIVLVDHGANEGF